MVYNYFPLVFSRVKFKVIINLYVLVLYWDLPNFVRMSPLCKIVKLSFVLVFVASLRLSLHQPRQLLCVAPHSSFVKSKCNIASCASHYHSCRDFLMCQGFAVVHHYDWNLFISLNFTRISQEGNSTSLFAFDKKCITIYNAIWIFTWQM